MLNDDNATKLAEALDNHQMTDEEGQIIEEQTSGEQAATLKQAPEAETATAEKSEVEEVSPKETESTEKTETEEPELVETAADETGKRYVPETRFKKVWAKWKEAEAKLKKQPSMRPAEFPVTIPASGDKQDALEVELLRSTLSQFNPEHPDYDQDIDQLGFSLLEGSKNTKGQYTITRMEAGRRALAMAKKITSKLASVKAEAQTVKAQQSDQGITSRVVKRGAEEVNPDKMTLEEKEAWLKEHGNW